VLWISWTYLELNSKKAFKNKNPLTFFKSQCKFYFKESSSLWSVACLRGTAQRS